MNNEDRENTLVFEFDNMQEFMTYCDLFKEQIGTKKVIWSDATNYRDFFNKAVELLKQNKCTDAIICFEKALELNPIGLAARLGIAESYICLKDYKQAKECLMNAKRYIRPDFFAGSFYRKLGFIAIEEENYLLGYACYMQSKKFDNLPIADSEMKYIASKISVPNDFNCRKVLMDNNIPVLLLGDKHIERKQITTDGAVQGKKPDLPVKQNDIKGTDEADNAQGHNNIENLAYHVIKNKNADRQYGEDAKKNTGEIVTHDNKNTSNKYRFFAYLMSLISVVFLALLIISGIKVTDYKATIDKNETILADYKATIDKNEKTIANYEEQKKTTQSTTQNQAKQIAEYKRIIDPLKNYYSQFTSYNDFYPLDNFVVLKKNYYQDMPIFFEHNGTVFLSGGGLYSKGEWLDNTMTVRFNPGTTPGTDIYTFSNNYNNETFKIAVIMLP